MFIVSTITPSGETETSSTIFIDWSFGISCLKLSAKLLICSTNLGLTIIVIFSFSFNCLIASSVILYKIFVSNFIWQTLSAIAATS